MPYDFARIEPKWQRYWLEHKSFAALDPQDAGNMPHAYVLDMFPYPSGSGLHVGHPEGYTATDIYSRYLRMRGYNVLHPMGWDAFGLPAEQYAIKTNTHPRITTERNIANFRRQIQMLGLGYDWDREVDTTDPKYYRWTQWIFLQLFNSYYDPIQRRAMPISHLENELQNQNLVVAPDGSIVENPVQEGLEPITGEAPRIERTWEELTHEERLDVIESHRLAYTDEAPVNWCPALGTVLANEEVIDGRSEVGGFPVERRPMRQWMLRITAYADRLLEDLDLLDWPESLKEMQRNWIGRSTGAEVDFRVDPSSLSEARNGVAQGSEPQPPAHASQWEDDQDEDLTITVFTTRPDTLYGATYMVLAPEHPLVDQIASPTHRETIEAYRTQIAGKSERDRMVDSRDKTGVFTGAFAINPINDEKIPIYIADYVLMGYGTGAIMAVPGHDERDFEFATRFNLPIRQVVVENRGDAPGAMTRAFCGEGFAVNSPLIDGLPTAQAKEKMIEVLEREDTGRRRVHYKLRDWLFSRQRYWGEPFPILLDEDDRPVALPESQLPVTLPDMSDFKPTGTPEPPLSKAGDWVIVRRDGQTYRRETNTMPQWAGSCWYYLRYIDPHNDERFVDPEKERYWMPVNLYVGGVEHAVLHLLYARFWHKVLFDLGHVSSPEPFKRLVNQGLILGQTEYHFFEDEQGRPISTTELRDIGEEATPDGVRLIAFHRQTGVKVHGKRIDEVLVEKKGDGFVLKANPDIRVDARAFKMSKSRGNVANPDEIVAEYGADALRLYIMYMGPLEAQKPWATRDIVGMSRFLNAVWRNLVGEELEGPEPTSNLQPATSNPHPASSNHPKITNDPVPPDLDRMLHRTIKKVGEDIENLRFNTAIAELIKLNNEMGRLPTIPRALAQNFVLLLAPFAPHIAEELWTRLGNMPSLVRHEWPSYDPARLVESSIELPVQVNGKLRDRITVPADADEETIFTLAEGALKVRPWIEGKTIHKRLYVPKKLVNIVVG